MKGNKEDKQYFWSSNQEVNQQAVEEQDEVTEETNEEPTLINDAPEPVADEPQQSGPRWLRK